MWNLKAERNEQTNRAETDPLNTENKLWWLPEGRGIEGWTE